MECDRNLRLFDDFKWDVIREKNRLRSYMSLFGKGGGAAHPINGNFQGANVCPG